MSREQGQIHQEAYKTAKDRQREHKCYKCLWAKWSDVESATCMFPRCFNEVNRQKYSSR